jgi:membrane-associated phospholipid phosphatase
MAEARETPAHRIRNKALSVLREAALNDWLVFAYLAMLNAILLAAEPSSGRTLNQWRFGSLFFGYTFLVAWVRANAARTSWPHALAYRAAQFSAVLGSYLMFRDYLPVANPSSLDLALYRFDLRWFGVEPALWMDGRLTPAITEWFAFFYYSYFYIIALHLFPLLFRSSDHTKVATFGAGMTLVALIGHTLYIVVPGYGPFRALADHFQQPLEGGVFWHLVLKTVEAGGAQKDIFPSLHTAFPSFVALFSFHFRRENPFRYTWPIVAFFALNIMGATMVLRWHYLIDVVAGLALAFVAYFGAVRVVRFETATRRERGSSPVWPAWS